MIRVIPLGVNGYFPSFGRQTMSFLVLAGEQALLLDAGTGVGRLVEPELARLAAPYANLDIVLSHYHLDHVIGLSYLPAIWGRGRIRIHGPARPLVDAEPEEALDRLLGQPLFSASYRTYPMPTEPVPITEECFNLGELRLRVWRQQHPGGSIGMRIGDEIAYVTDTVVEPLHADRVRGVKLLLHEMWLSDDEAESAAPAGHSYLSGVASLARQAEVGSLMLVHHHPKRPAAEVEMLAKEAEKLAGIPTSFGEEGWVVEID